MTKIDPLQLHKAIGREEFDHIALSSALSDYSGVRQKITELMKAQTIVRIKKGLYVFGSSLRRQPICKEILANLIYGPSCISLEYALSYHGLIPERVEAVTSVTLKKSKQFDTPIGRFSYSHISKESYQHGIEQIWVDKNHPVLMATPEKALCDYIVIHNVPIMPDPKAAAKFLEFNLRIEADNWERFDLRQMIKLNKFYKSPAIAYILEVL